MAVFWPASGKLFVGISGFRRRFFGFAELPSIWREISVSPALSIVPQITGGLFGFPFPVDEIPAGDGGSFANVRKRGGSGAPIGRCLIVKSLSVS
jgi:hypothetical protein